MFGRADVACCGDDVGGVRSQGGSRMEGERRCCFFKFKTVEGVWAASERHALPSCLLLCANGLLPVDYARNVRMLLPTPRFEFHFAALPFYYHGQGVDARVLGVFGC